MSTINRDINMSTKFGLLIDFDVPNTVASTSRKPEVVFSSRGRHLEKNDLSSHFRNVCSDLDEIR